MFRAMTCAAAFAVLASSSMAGQASNDAAEGRPPGVISNDGGVSTKPAHDPRNRQTTKDAGPASGTSGKNADNNVPLKGPKRESTDRDLKTDRTQPR